MVNKGRHKAAIGSYQSPARQQKKRTFVIKAVYPVDTGTLVVASEDEEVFWIFDFVGKE
jgi:hypothetical protein